MSDSSHPHRSVRAADLARTLDGLANDPLARRDFLGRMGAALALAGLGACTRAPREQIVPYVTQPPELRPGVAQHYATASVLDGYATGIVVESHGGRPTKIEGNPAHPASLGAAGVLEQASVLSLYDPKRARGVTANGTPATWDELARTLAEGGWTKDGGRGLHLHIEPTSSPTVVVLLDELRRRFPHARISTPISARANAWNGARLAFGRPVEPRWALDRADVILALDADFLHRGPASLRLARQFADRRTNAPMNRLYVVEPLVTVTGTNADHRLRARARDVRTIVTAIAASVGVPGVPPSLAPEGMERRFADAVARDLAAHRGRSLVLAGDAQPPEVHALAHALNEALGNVGTTVTYAPSPLAEVAQASLRDVLAGGGVDTLVIVGTNEVYTSPDGAELARLVARTRASVYLGTHDDETAATCRFRVARAHPLEAWGDARAFDGTVSIVQPLIEPLFEGRTEIELLALLAGDPAARPYDRVRRTFGGSDPAWRAALKRGVVDGSGSATAMVSIQRSGVAKALSAPMLPVAPDTLEPVTRSDARVHDGRFANDAWLLELPAPITRLTWTNAATLAVETARELGVTTGDEVELRADGGRSVRAPVCVVPGQAKGTVGLTLGWGRTRGAELAHGRGANAHVLGGTTAVTLAKTGVTRRLPVTQEHRSLEGRDHAILHHHAVGHGGEATPKRRLSLYDREPGPSAWQWAMAIDLTRCIACEACVVACQAENNVPTVGPDNVILNREMHWLRVDSYVVGDEREPRYLPQPMLCQHCEKAPCEYVCPVNATVHSPDGLNEMVYNRCVGTRYCSNNCPYKVRRFNWFDFHRDETATEQLVHNPDVTVRERGVMEKCTFCVQRLREWEIGRQQGRSVPAPRTACQQTCPTGAIVFGDLRAPGSEVQRLHDDPRAFGALAALGTEPRVRYLARLRNPNRVLA